MSYRFASATAIAVAASIAVSAAQPARHTVYAAVLDKDHVPVTDMQATDFDVKEGGRTAEVISVKRATKPLRVAIVDSDAGTGAYQQGLLQFMQKLLDYAEFGITSVLVQPQKVTDFTSDPSTLSKALDGLGKRGTQRGGQLMEAINDAAKTVAAPGRRGVILVTRYGGEGTSSLSPKDVRDNLRKSGATLYVLSIKGMDRMQATGPTGAGAPNAIQQQMDLRNDEVNEGRFNLQLVLGDGSRESGGRHDEIVAVSLTKSVEAIADELLNQYEIVYAVPAGAKPGDNKLSVSTKRKNVSVYAPTMVPPQ